LGEAPREAGIHASLRRSHAHVHAWDTTPLERRTVSFVSGARDRTTDPVTAAPGLDLHDICHEPARNALTEATAKAIAYWKDECARDLPKLLTHFTPDAEVVTPDGSYRGKDAVAALYQKSFDAFPGLTVDVTAAYAGRDAQCVQFRAVLFDHDQKGWLVEGVNVMRLEDGRISYLRSFEDAPRLLPG
jgi:hypothetical protein